MFVVNIVFFCFKHSSGTSANKSINFTRKRLITTACFVFQVWSLESKSNVKESVPKYWCPKKKILAADDFLNFDFLFFDKRFC
jgi:hypothetical protein